MVSFGGSINLNLQKLASYNSELPFQKAFTECELATSIPNYVAKSSTKRVGNVILVDDARHIGQGLALAIRIVELEAPGGGGWTGGKGLALEATLYRDGAIVETIRKSQRTNSHSPMLIKPTTCSILDSNARVLADQITDWVKRKIWALGLED